MKFFVILFCVSLLLFGCVKQPDTVPNNNGGNNVPVSGAELTVDSSLGDDLNELSDLQDSLNDNDIEDSGINDGSFG